MSQSKVTPMNVSEAEPRVDDDQIDPLLIETAGQQANQNPESGSEKPKTNMVRNGKKPKIMIALLAVLCYILTGIMIYSWWFEGWTVTDSVYFSVYTLTTVGYGDMGPTSDGAKVTTMFFALFGISIIAVAIGVIGAWLVELHAQALKMAKEKAQRALEKVFAEALDGEDPVAPVEKEEDWGMLIVRKFAPTLAVMCVSTLSMSLIEKWSFVDGIYWVVITATTIGYGDVAPATSEGRWLAVLLLPMLVLSMSRALSTITNAVLNQGSSVMELVSREITMEDLMEMDDGDGKVTELEFYMHLLICMGKVDQEDFDLIKRQFKKLDADGNGYLDEKDLHILKERAAAAQRKRVGSIWYVATGPRATVGPRRASSVVPRASVAASQRK